jgi:co-chaperonin GroES (HSP10)
MENSQKFQAKNFNIVVTPKVLENKLSGGFDITGYVNANESQQSGTVVSVGERCVDAKGEITLNEGQVIIFKKHNATTMTIEGQGYLIVPYTDVILTL